MTHHRSDARDEAGQNTVTSGCPTPRPGRGKWRTLCALGCVCLLAGCSWFSNATSSIEGEGIPPLEVPPDLVAPKGSAPLLIPEVAAPKAAAECDCGPSPALEGISQRVLPPNKGVRIVRDDRHRWLLVEVEPEQLWPLGRKFLTAQGYRIASDEPAIGLLESDWKPRGAGEGQPPLWRERLRLRFEPGQAPGTTEAYLSQSQAERVGEQWVLRAPDDERVEEMLNRFARYLGAEDVTQAVPLKPLAAQLGSDDEGNTVLRVAAPFDLVWRRTGIALDRLGYVIEDRNRANRLYRIYSEVASGKTEEEIKYGKPESATVRLVYQLQLSADGDGTRISVLNSRNQADSSEQARLLLIQLQAQYR